MNLAWCVSIYFISWWLVFFIILPINIKSHHEAGAPHVPGAEASAPYRPNLRRKVFTTSWITVLLVGALWLGFYFGLIHIPNLN
jgi:predicted secreted protein